MANNRRVQLRALSAEQAETVVGGMYPVGGGSVGSNITSSTGIVHDDWSNSADMDTYQDGAFGPK